MDLAPCSANDGRPLRLLITGASYNEDERFKLLEAWGERFDLTYVTVESFDTLAMGEFTARRSTNRIRMVLIPWWRIGGRYVFRPRWREYWAAHPDVIQSELQPWTPEFWSLMLPLMLLHPRAKLVVCVRKNTRHIPRGPLGWIERLLTWIGRSRIDVLVAVSTMTAELYRTRLGFANKRIEVLHNLPIDPAVYTGERAPTEGVFRIGYVGSILPHKGVGVLAEAFARLRADVGDHVELQLLGRPADDALAEQLASIPGVELLGLRSHGEIPKFLATLDAFVLPSLVLPDHEEHDGLALLEAMAMALPTVSTRGGVVPDFVRHGENGLMDPPGDVDALAKSLRELHDDGALRDRLGAQARSDVIDRVGLDALTRAWIDLYHSLA